MIYKIVVDKQPMTNPSGEKKEYEIDIEELRFKKDVYDSLVITLNEDYVMRRLSLSEYNVLTVLDEPVKEPLENINIELFEGDNYIYLYDMAGNKIVAQYLVKNEFNELYITQSEMNSAIEQSAKAIELSVNGKIARVDGDIEDLSANLELKVDKNDNDQVVSMINASADEITLNSNRLIINSTNFKLNSEGNITATGGTVGGFTLGKNQFSANIQLSYTYTTADQQRLKQILLGNIIPTSEDYDKYDFSHDGILNSLDSYWLAKIVYGTERGIAIFKIDTSKSDRAIQLISGIGDIRASIGIFGSYFENITSKNANFNTLGIENDIFMANGNITCVSLTQTSKAESKKNFEKLQNGLDIVKNTDIYKYNFKTEEDDNKKHIGFVIGDKYKYSKEVTSKENDGVDVYSFVSVCCKAIQEQQEQIEKLQKENQQKDEILANLIERLEKLEKEANNGQD